MKISVLFVLVIAAKAFCSDSRSLSNLDKVMMPDSVAVDSGKVNLASQRRVCDTVEILEKFSPKLASKHWSLESGLLFNPTTFSYDFSSETELFKANSHPSFFLCPGIRGAFNWGINALSLKAFYKGAYDFYFGSETSGPVISRLQNPGVSFAYSRGSRSRFLRGFELAGEWAHESNGMFIETQQQFNSVKSSFPEDYIVQDFASMGWNYIAGNSTINIELGEWKINSFLSLKGYMNQSNFRFSPLEDSSLFYLGADKPHIWQYDGFLLDVSIVVPTDFLLLRYIHLPGLPWTYGAINLGTQAGGLQAGIPEMFDFPSYHITLKGRWWQLPWMGFITMERGYAKPIAYYSLQTWTLRLGVELNNFNYITLGRKARPPLR